MNWVNYIVGIFASMFGKRKEVENVEKPKGSNPNLPPPPQIDAPPPKQEKMNWRNNITLITSAGHGSLNPDTGKPVNDMGWKMHKYGDKGFDYNGWVIEGVLNREWEKEFIAQAEERGYKTKAIAPDHNDLSLTLRCKTAAEVKGECMLFPIHFNASPKHNATGTEYFTTRGSTESDKLGEIFYYNTYVLQRLFPEFKVRADVVSDGDHDKESNFREIREFEKLHKDRHTSGACLYLEIEFFDHINGYNLGKDSKFRYYFIKALLDAVDTYYEKRQSN